MIRVPHPDGDRQIGREADGQVVAEVVRRPRLGGDVMSGNHEIAVPTERERPVAVIGQHLRHDEADLRAERRLAVVAWIKTVEGTAVVCHDLQDRLRVLVGALRGQRAGAGGHLDQWHFVTAQRQARLVAAGRLIERRQAHAAGDVDDPIGARAQFDFDSRNVEGVAQGEGQGLPAVIPAVVVVRRVAAAVRHPDVDWLVQHPGAHRELLRLDGGGVGEDLEGRARLARGDRHVVLPARHVRAS